MGFKGKRQNKFLLTVHFDPSLFNRLLELEQKKDERSVYTSAVYKRS